MFAASDEAGAAFVALDGDLPNCSWRCAVLQGSRNPRPGWTDVELAVVGRLSDDDDVPLRRILERLGVVDVHPVLIFFVGRWIRVGLLIAGEKLIAVEFVVCRQRNGGRSVEGSR